MNDTELALQFQQALAARGAGPRATSCPAPEALLALVEGRGSESDRLETLAHASACLACHRELALLQALHAAGTRGTANPASRLVTPRLRWLAAAAVVVVAGGTVWLTRGRITPSTVDTLRGPASEQAVTLLPAVPSSSGRVLAWRSLPGATAYRLEILDQDNDVLFTKQTTDTAVLAPPLGGRGTTWWVRASRADHSTLRSPLATLEPPQ